MSEVTSVYPQLKRGVLFMACSAICAAVGQLFWKLSVDFGLPALVLGFVLYGAGALVMIWAYRYGPLASLQPVLGIGYVLSLILALAFLDEHITPGRVLGVSLVLMGVWMVTGDRRG